MSFETLIGVAPVVERLRRAYDQGRLAHAYLFAGPEGCGKFEVARLLARGLVCRERSSIDSCAACKMCRLFAGGIHPDVFFLDPPEKKRNIPVELAREAIQKMALRNSSGERKVLMVRDAERLSVEAMNAILKLIEEPRGDALILLTSRAPATLLPTIRSRCQIVSFSGLPVPEVRTWLVSRHGKEAADAGVAAGLSGGSPGRALDLLNDPELFEGRAAFARTLVGLDGENWPARAEELVAAVKVNPKEEAQVRREHLRRRLDLALLLFGDVLALSGGGPPEDLRNSDLAEILAGEARALGPDGASRAIDILGRARDDLDGNANLALLVEHTYRALSRAAG